MNLIDTIPAPPAETSANTLAQPSHRSPQWPRRSRWAGLKTLFLKVVQVLARICDTLFGRRFADAVGILTYHRICDPVVGHPIPTWNVTPHKFREQLTGLLGRGFTPWPLSQVIQYRRDGRAIPRNVFVVTFDDGYMNVYENAFPILRELKIPATIFLPTAYLDSTEPFPFDDWSSAGVPSVPKSTWISMTTAQARELLASGWIEFGSHTHTHQDFAGWDDEFAAELTHAAKVLKAKFGLENVSFAFPYGIVTPEMCAAVEHAGHTCALATHDDLVRPESDRFRWGRFDVSQQKSAGWIATQLSGWDVAIRDFCRQVFQGTQVIIPNWRDETVRRSLLSLIDQAVLSVSNFATNVIIGHWSKSELGVYSLAFRVLLFLRTFQDQVVSTPYTIFSTKHTGIGLRRFTGSTLVHQIGASVVSLLCLGGLVLLLTAGWGPVSVLPALKCMILVLPFLSFREYLRQISLARLQVRMALMIDFLASGLYVTSLLAMQQFGWVSAGQAYLCMGLACAVACLWWLISSPLPFSIQPTRVGTDFCHNWKFGRWGLSSELMGSGTNMLLPWILASLHSQDAAGTFAASLAPVGLANLFAMGILTIVLPQAVHGLRDGGVARLQTILAKYAGLLFAVMGSFALLMLVAGEPLTVFIFGASYAGCAPVPAILATVFLIGSLGAVAAQGLLAMERPRTNLAAEFSIFCVTMTIAAWSIPTWGATGAATAMLGGTSTGVLIRIYSLFYWLKRFEPINHEALA